VKAKYTRRRADGATFTARQAKEHQLIDEVEDLPAAIRRAAAAAGLSSFKAIGYDRTRSLLERFTGLQIRDREPFPALADLSDRLTPRLWYLAPSADGGILAPQP
jgi:ClpP class serine protease